VKFAGLGAGSGRNALRERQHADRLATPPLRQRYPQLTSLEIDFDFSDSTGSLPSPLMTVFHPPAPAYFSFVCPYNDCDGEFKMTKLVDLAVSSREPRTSGQLSCSGTRHRGAACTLCLEYAISPRWA